MRGCGVFTGILFSRKLCPQPAATTCGRCATALCKQHVRPQRSGPFLCPSCDAYTNDDDDHWRYSNRDNGWHYRDRSIAQDRVAGAATGAAAGAAAANANELSDEDKAGLSTNAAGAWHGPDDTSADSDDADSGTDDGDFDAS
jgi:hypothetical protein